MMTCIKELMQPSFQLEPLMTPLVERLVHLLNNVHVQSRSEQKHSVYVIKHCLFQVQAGITHLLF